MLPSAYRMRRGADFTAAVRRGRRAARRTVVVHALPGDDPTTLRIGFVVSRQVGGAVVRNRVKRRLRAAVAARAPHVPSGWMVVVRATPAAGQAGWADLAGDLELALGRALDRPAPALRPEVTSGLDAAAGPSGEIG